MVKTYIPEGSTRRRDIECSKSTYALSYRTLTNLEYILFTLLAILENDTEKG